MYYNDSYEQAGEFLRIAIKQLTNFKIPPDPVNYIVMYDYASGRNRRLMAEIERCIKDGESVSSDHCRYWYENYVVQDLALKTDNLIRDFRHSLDELLQFIAQSGSAYPEYAARLRSFSEALEQADNFGDVIGLVKQIVQETALVTQSTDEMVAHLNTVQSEVDSLRQQLATKDTEANTDQLTGLVNRRGFEKGLASAMQRAQSDATELCVIMIDIDHFKVINDTHGHLVGDNVLQIVAHTLKDGIKGKDLAARYGGEEFVIVLPETPLAGGVILADKIRSLFENQTWRARSTGQHIGKITISAGVALYQAGEPAEKVIQRADEALYVSKNSGRNRVTSEDQISNE